MGHGVGGDHPGSVRGRYGRRRARRTSGRRAQQHRDQIDLHLVDQPGGNRLLHGRRRPSPARSCRRPRLLRPRPRRDAAGDEGEGAAASSPARRAADGSGRSSAPGTARPPRCPRRRRRCAGRARRRRPRPTPPRPRLGVRGSCGSAKSQRCSSSPSSPSGLPGSVSGPATNPSSDMLMSTTTVPMPVSLGVATVSRRLTVTDFGLIDDRRRAVCRRGHEWRPGREATREREATVRGWETSRERREHFVSAAKPGQDMPDLDSAPHDVVICRHRPGAEHHPGGTETAGSRAAGRARGDRGVPAAGGPGADRWQHPELALRGGHRSGAPFGDRRVLPARRCRVPGGRGGPGPHRRAAPGGAVVGVPDGEHRQGAGARAGLRQGPAAAGGEPPPASTARSCPRCGVSPWRCDLAGSGRCGRPCTWPTSGRSPNCWASGQRHQVALLPVAYTKAWTSSRQRGSRSRASPTGTGTGRPSDWSAPVRVLAGLSARRRLGSVVQGRRPRRLTK